MRLLVKGDEASDRIGGIERACEEGVATTRLFLATRWYLDDDVGAVQVAGTPGVGSEVLRAIWCRVLHGCLDGNICRDRLLSSPPRSKERGFFVE